MKVAIIVTTLAIVTLLLTACNSDNATPTALPILPTAVPEPTSAATATGSLPTNEVPTTLVESTPTGIVRQPLPSITIQVITGTGLLVQYRKQGGLAGASTTLIINQNGTTSLKSKLDGSQTGTLSSSQLATVKQQLDAVRSLSDLQDRYDQRTVADDFYTTVTFPTADASNTTRSIIVAEMGNNGTVPAPLATLIATLNSLAQNQ